MAAAFSWFLQATGIFLVAFLASLAALRLMAIAQGRRQTGSKARPEREIAFLFEGETMVDATTRRIGCWILQIKPEPT